MKVHSPKFIDHSPEKQLSYYTICTIRSVLNQGYILIRTRLRRNPVNIYGYTLIELLVGMAIMGLIFSLGLVSFRDFSRRQSLQSATRNLIGDLRLAQNYALSGKKPDTNLCNSPSVLQGYNLEVTSQTSYIIAANCSGGRYSVKEVTLSDEFAISIPTTNPIIFKTLGKGTNIGDPLTIILTQVATNNIQAVTVTSGGEIR